MTSDLFGKAPTTPFPLSLTRKRQAALLYYFADIDRLRELKAEIDGIMQWLDGVMERRKFVDTVGLRDMNWDVGSTMANWASHAWPSLKNLQLHLAKALAQRAFEVYWDTAVSSVGLGLSHFSTLWMAPEQEEEYKKRLGVLEKHARFIDDTLSRDAPRWEDSDFARNWRDRATELTSLPKFRVLTDVQAESGRAAPRTGVYVPQNDPNGALQFAWTGGGEGGLVDCSTFNELGVEALQVVGRNDLWLDDLKMYDFFKKSGHQDILKRDFYYDRAVSAPHLVGELISRQGFATRPVKWYFVEKLEGEYETETLEPPSVQDLRGRVEGGQPCSREGWWFTPARLNSRRYFKVGEVMPNFGGDYGSVIWQWDADQSESKT